MKTQGLSTWLIRERKCNVPYRVDTKRNIPKHIVIKMTKIEVKERILKIAKETHVNPWLIHVNVWQKPLQYCKVISLQIIKINGKKKKK